MIFSSWTIRRDGTPPPTTTTNPCDPSSDPFYFWFHGVFSSCVYLAGFLGNLVYVPVLVSVLYRTCKKESLRRVRLSEFYVLLLVLLVTSVVQLFIVTWEWSLRKALYHFQMFFEASGPYLDYVRENNETINSFILVFISINRYKACSIKWNNRNLGVVRTFGVVAVITVLSSLFHLPRLFEDVYVTKVDPCFIGRGGGGGEAVNVTTHEPAPWVRNNTVYAYAYKTVANYVVTFIVPFVSLFVFNFSIVVKMRRRRRYQREAVTAPSKESTRVERQVFRVCAIVVVTFFVTKFPYFIVACVRHVDAATSPHEHRRMSKTSTYKAIRSVCIFLVNLNFCSTFVTFILFSPKMRKYFSTFYCFRKEEQEQGRRCSDDHEADTAVADTAVADTAVADTAVADTAVADTAVADTAVADTAVATRHGTTNVVQREENVNQSRREKSVTRRKEGETNPIFITHL